MPTFLMPNFNLFHEGAILEVRSTDEETVVNRVCLLIEGQKFLFYKSQNNSHKEHGKLTALIKSIPHKK